MKTKSDWVEGIDIFDLVAGDEVLATCYSPRLVTIVVLEEKYTKDIWYGIEKSTGVRVMIDDEVLYKVKVDDKFRQRRYR